MDILRKMFGMKNTEEKEKSKDEFRKPSWFEDYETDDELFDSSRKFMVDIFTNPFELQKYFEQQIQDMFKTTQEEEAGKLFDRNFRDEYMKPGFEDNFFKDFRKHKESLDTDLDGEIYADQLRSLLHRLQSPEVKSILPDNSNIKGKIKVKKEKLSDEEIIMGKIHGTINEENVDKSSPTKRRDIIIPRMQPHLGGTFEGTYQSPKMFRQSVMTQTVRKPDGSFETKKVISDSDGNVKTTITRIKDGKTETITSFAKDGEGQTKSGANLIPSIKVETDSKGNQGTTELIISSIPTDRNIYISKHGYAMPKNMW